MKRTGLLIICILSVFILNAQTKIGISVANQYAERWVKELKLMTNAANDLGEEVMIEIARDDAQKQFEQSKSMIDKGIKVLILIPVDGKDASRIVEYAHEKNTKVIAYDRLILNSDLDLYISFNSVRIGELITNYLVQLVPTGNYLFINGPEADFNSSLIRQGVMNILTPHLNYSKIKLVLDKDLNEWSDLTAYLLMMDFLSNEKAPDAIITAADIIGIGVMQAIEDNAMNSIPIVGQDADLLVCKAIMQGKYSATILKKPKTIATKALEIAVYMANNKPIEEIKHFTNNGKIDVPSILIEPILITKDNLEKEIIESDFLSKESVFEE